MQEFHHKAVHADRQSLAAGRDINVTIHVCELQQLLDQLSSETMSGDLAGAADVQHDAALRAILPPTDETAADWVRRMIREHACNNAG